MKMIPLFFLLFSNLLFAQKNTNKEQIQLVMKNFLDTIKEQDSVKFNALFHENPVVWIGIYKEKSYQKIIEKTPKEKLYFSENYRNFIKGISGSKPVEEKYDNVKIIEDGSIASVNFDYSFWFNHKMLNWGKEIWTLVKINGVWKITTVLFSMEMSEYYPQPPLKQRVKQK